MVDSSTAVAAVAVDFSSPLNIPKSDGQPSHVEPPPASAPLFPNPSAGVPPPPSILTPPLPSIQQSFQPAAPQFSTVSYNTTPQGVIMTSTPAVGTSAPPHFPGMAPPYSISGQPVRYMLPPMPNGYPAIPQGTMPSPGILRYPSPYGQMIRPAFPPRLMVGVMPPLARPPLFAVCGPIMPSGVRPALVPIIMPIEKPQTTVYIGKISTSVGNEFMLSLLELCGSVKTWKRPQGPTGTLKGFGFCEFESAEGVLRALRLLNKLSVDGQELMVNVNQTTRGYLERFVAKKSESSKNTEEAETVTQKEEPTAAGGDTNETVKSEASLKRSLNEQKTDDGEKLKMDITDTFNFGLVNNENREADREAVEKLREMLEERLKSNPLPPPPPPPPQVPVDGSGNSNLEQHSELRDGESDENVAKNYPEDKNKDEKNAESKPSNENDRTELGSPDRSRRHDRPRDRDREQKQEKDRELERYEREREQERSKREKDREFKGREDERRYKVREKEWEAKERERDHWQKKEREREKERAQDRKWEIMDQERDSDDGFWKKRKYKTIDEERKRRQREKEDDLADRLREEEEIVEAKMREEEEKQKKLHEALNVISSQPANGLEKISFTNETNYLDQDKAVDQNLDHKPSHMLIEGEGVLPNGIINEPTISSNVASDTQKNNNNAPATRKLGFGLSGSGKRASVPSVFNADEDEDAQWEKMMRPLVPIDYSTEDQHTAEPPSVSEFPSANVVAATEFVKHISTVTVKEEKPDVNKEKGRRSHERSSQRDRGRHEEGTNNSTHASKKTEKPKLLDAKQLIDTIPKTRDELFAYQINWVIYDQNALHERLTPWISKKITDFLGEEEATLVDYIVSSTQEHVNAGVMLERLRAILDDEAEIFVLKMWRMLIFEIKKVETGLTPKFKS